MAQALPELIRKVLACPQYQALLQKYPDFADVIESEAMQMCVDLKDHMENPKDYVLCNGQICYKVMDGVVFDVVKGYKTAFAYLQEATNGSLQDEDTALTKALTLRVPCGRFSYAKLGSPKILGVSGTIEALGDYEWKVMQRFGITSYTLVPSVYGQNNFKFLSQAGGIAPITISPDKDFFHTIASQALFESSLVYIQYTSRSLGWVLSGEQGGAGGEGSHRLLPGCAAA